MVKKNNDYNKKGGEIMRNLSKILMPMILLMSLGLWQTTNSVEATELPKCTMTIESDRHNDKNNVFAQASGACKGLVEGYYAVSANVFHIVGMVSYPVTKNGQKFTVGISTDPWDAELTVYTVLKTVEEPKTEPVKSEPVKEEPKTEQPKTEQPKTEQPKTQPVTTTQPKTQTAPKQETKTTTQPVTTQPKTTTSTPKQETTTKTTNASQQKTTETSKTDTQKVAVASNNEDSKKDTETEEEVKEEVAEKTEEAADATEQDEGGEEEKDIKVVEQASGEIASEKTETGSTAVLVFLGLLAMIMIGVAIWFFKFRKVR